MKTNRKNRWSSKDECQKWLQTSNATGLRRLAALDYLNKEAAKSK